MTTTRIFRGRAARASRAASSARSQHFLRTSAAAELVRDACLRPSRRRRRSRRGQRPPDRTAGAGRPAGRRVELDPRLARGLRGRWPNVRGDRGRRRHGGAAARAVPGRREPAVQSHQRPAPSPAGRPRAPRSSARISSSSGALPASAASRGRARCEERRLGRVLRRPSVARRLPPARSSRPPAVDAGVLVFRRRTRRRCRAGELGRLPRASSPAASATACAPWRGARDGRELDCPPVGALWNGSVDM